MLLRAFCRMIYVLSLHVAKWPLQKQKLVSEDCGHHVVVLMRNYLLHICIMYM